MVIETRKGKKIIGTAMSNVQDFLYHYHGKKKILVSLTGKPPIIRPLVVEAGVSDKMLENVLRKYTEDKFEAVVIDWPDGGTVPDGLLLELSEYLIEQDTYDVVIVFCSAGRGRTGTLMALIYGLQEEVDASLAVSHIRKQEWWAVETELQVEALERILGKGQSAVTPSILFERGGNDLFYSERYLAPRQGGGGKPHKNQPDKKGWKWG